MFGLDHDQLNTAAMILAAASILLIAYMPAW